MILSYTSLAESKRRNSLCRTYIIIVSTPWNMKMKVLKTARPVKVALYPLHLSISLFPDLGNAVVLWHSRWFNVEDMEAQILQGA